MRVSRDYRGSTMEMDACKVTLDIVKFLCMDGWHIYHDTALMLLGTRFTNSISYFEPGPHEPYSDIEAPCRAPMLRT
jgi:hypothetical protein